MSTATSEDTEITLGTGKMLGVFFALVILCAVFFAMGFSFGRTAGRPSISDLLPASPTNETNSVPVKTGKGNRSSQQYSGTYKAVGQKDSDAQLTTTEASSADPVSSPAGSIKATVSDTPTGLLGRSYYVQVAAVSKQEDAQALLDALKKKEYPALIADASADKLFHVQIGPFADLKDAEGTKAKLINDGYNPILKK
ncbi:MAG: hypothetical protein NVS1B11_04270 [Terriglobales bacterium]